MNTSANNRVTLISAASVFLLCLSLLLPRVLQGSEGFAGATEASLLFFALMAGSFALSVYAILFSLNHYEQLATRQRVFAVLPSILIALTGITFYLSL